MASLGEMTGFLALVIGLASADKMETILQQFNEMSRQLVSMNDRFVHLQLENLEKTFIINNRQKQLDIYAEQILTLTKQQDEYQQILDAIEGVGGSGHHDHKMATANVDDTDLFNRTTSELQNNGGKLTPEVKYGGHAYMNSPHARSGRLVQGEGMRVGFSAVHTPHDYGPLVSDQIIKFDKVLSNVGNAYHANSGIFTAPVDGLYAVYVTISAWKEKSGHTFMQLMQNGNHLCSIWVSQFDQSSQAMVLNLNQGDEIYVITSTTGHVILGATYSSFSGFLLY